MSDRRITSVAVNDAQLTVQLTDGSMISAPLAWYPRLANATVEQRSLWRIVGGGYGLHWPEIDEDIDVDGLMRRAPSPEARAGWRRTAENLAVMGDDQLVWPEFANEDDDKLEW